MTDKTALDRDIEQDARDFMREIVDALGLVRSRTQLLRQLDGFGEGTHAHAELNRITNFRRELETFVLRLAGRLYLEQSANRTGTDMAATGESQDD